MIEDDDYKNYIVPLEHRKMILKLLEDVTRALDELKIEYWIDGGTLLGAVRHGGQIPHDDDADLGVSWQDYNLLIKQFPVFEALGYKVQYLPQQCEIIKVFIPNKWLVGGQYRDFGTPTLDIFPWKRKNKQLELYAPRQRKEWPNCIYLTSDMYPMRVYDYDGIKVKGARNPMPYLDKMYPLWPTLAVVEVRDKFQKAKTIKFQIHQAAPAEVVAPSGPS